MKTYAICGLSSRAIGHFAIPFLGNPKLPEFEDYSAHARLVAILDMDRERVAAWTNGTIPTFIGQTFCATLNSPEAVRDGGSHPSIFDFRHRRWRTILAATRGGISERAT